ncbi:SCO4848 family membrane protein [Kribbella sp. NPDC050124]|uniref:SCO4848 family membrane protein n=1 Tax=Kribbella sp. NPDC050124 TaxID=3364114 RepID=UPI0037947C56
MKLERKHAFVLIGIAVWNVVTYLRFIKALADTEGRPTGYYVAHTILIVVNLLIAGVLGTWGVKAYKASKASAVQNSPV